MKEILLTNDDGFEAKGLLSLANVLKSNLNANVTIVAPSNEKSASSHSLTLTRPLRFVGVGDGFFKLDDATPADCVYLALEKLFNGKKPDLVISGINHGANLGEDVGYSGTIGAAAEAVLQGVKALSVSQYYERNSLDELGFELACELTLEVAKKLLFGEFCLKEREVLSLNVPAVSRKDFRGFKAARCGKRAYSTNASLHKNPRGLEFWWLGTPNMLSATQDESSDISLVKAGYATLTPLKFDFTSFESLDAVECLAKGLN